MTFISSWEDEITSSIAFPEPPEWKHGNMYGSVGNARHGNRSGVARDAHSSGKRPHPQRHTRPNTMKKELVVAFLVVLSLPPAGALVVVNPGAQQLRVGRALQNSALKSRASTRSACRSTGVRPAPTTSVSAGAAVAAPGGCGCSRLLPMGSVASRAQDLWRISTAAAAARRSSRGSLGATVASWPAVEGTGSSSSDDGRARSSKGAGAGKGRVVLIEQEGPAWTEIVWDEVR